MKLSNSQVKVIALLNLVVISLLIVAVAIVAHFRPTSQTQPPTYSRVRTATISLNPNLSWELELLGSNQEEAVFSYIYNETIYLFGNTLSSDYDFEGACIFLAKIDTLGKLYENSFFYYGQPSHKLVAVLPSNDGFILAINAQKPYLLVINPLGEIIKTIENFTTSNEDIVNFMPYHDGWLLFTAPFNSTRSTFGLRCIFFNANLEFLFSNLATHLYSLSFFEIVLTSNGPIAFCNALTASQNTYIAVVEFPLTSSARVNIIDTHIAKAVGFSVHNGEYLLLTAYQGCSFLKLDANFNVNTVISISQDFPTHFLDAQDGYYAVFTPQSTYIFNNSLTKISTLAPLSLKTHKYLTQGLLLSTQDTNQSINILTFSQGAFTTLATLPSADPLSQSLLTLSTTFTPSSTTINLFHIHQKSQNLIITALRPHHL